MLAEFDVLDIHGRARQLFQDGGDRVQVLAALVGQLHRAVRALEQLHLQAALEASDLLTDRGLRQVQLLAGAGKAQQARGGFEGDQRLQRW